MRGTTERRDCRQAAVSAAGTAVWLLAAAAVLLWVRQAFFPSGAASVLLAVLVLRQADFGIRTTHGLLSIAGIFGILMAGPRLANMAAALPFAAFFINVVCILLLMILGCHNVIMYNHSTFVLGYLLLLGPDRNTFCELRGWLWEC